MTAYNELVKALREYSGCRKGEIARITSDAAAAIEELQADVEEQKQIAAHYEQSAKDWWAEACDYYAIASARDITAEESEELIKKFKKLPVGPIEPIKIKPIKPHWVSVEEPPKEHMWCFVYTDEPDMIMPIRIAFYTASCMGKGSWYHYESGSDITDEVDYWTEMLIEGPKLDHDLPWPIEPPQEVQE